MARLVTNLKEILDVPLHRAFELLPKLLGPIESCGTLLNFLLLVRILTSYIADFYLAITTALQIKVVYRLE